MKCEKYKIEKHVAFGPFKLLWNPVKYFSAEFCCFSIKRNEKWKRLNTLFLQVAFNHISDILVLRWPQIPFTFDALLLLEASKNLFLVLVLWDSEKRKWFESIKCYYPTTWCWNGGSKTRRNETFPGYLLLCKHSKIGFSGMQSFRNGIHSSVIKAI